MKSRLLPALLFIALALHAEAQILGANPFTPPPATKAKPVVTVAPATPPKAAVAPAAIPATFSNRTVIADGATLRKQVIRFSPTAALEIDIARLSHWETATSPLFSASWTNWFTPQV